MPQAAGKRHLKLAKSLAKVREQARKDTKTNVIARAWAEAPSLVPRGAGVMQMWGTEGLNSSSSGSQESLMKYVDENREKLEAQVTATRERAREQLRITDPVTATPVTTDQWLGWMDSNREKFERLLRGAHESRRAHNRRLEPLMSDMPQVERLRPVQPGRLDESWFQTLLQQESGFYSASSKQTPSCNLTFFHSMQTSRVGPSADQVRDGCCLGYREVIV